MTRFHVSTWKSFLIYLRVLSIDNGSSNLPQLPGPTFFVSREVCTAKSIKSKKASNGTGSYVLFYLMEYFPVKYFSMNRPDFYKAERAKTLSKVRNTYLYL